MEFFQTGIDPGWLGIMGSAGAEGIVDFIIMFFFNSINSLSMDFLN